jgi:predicted phage-related endonuclease
VSGATAFAPSLVSPATEVKVEQGTDEWLQLRLGIATASEFKNIMATIKSGESAQRRNYRAQLVAERLSGRQAERFKSNAMQWGNDMEDLAMTTVMLQTGLVIEKCGIFVHNTDPIGDSPDGLIGEDACWENKCYELANHIATLKSGTMPNEHYAQVQGHMWMTGRSRCLFSSFAPELPETAQLFLQWIPRDDAYIAKLEAEVLKFLAEVEAEVEFIENYRAPEFAV